MSWVTRGRGQRAPLTVLRVLRVLLHLLAFSSAFAFHAHWARRSPRSRRCRRLLRCTWLVHAARGRRMRMARRKSLEVTRAEWRKRRLRRVSEARRRILDAALRGEAGARGSTTRPWRDLGMVRRLRARRSDLGALLGGARLLRPPPHTGGFARGGVALRRARDPVRGRSRRAAAAVTVQLAIAGGNRPAGDPGRALRRDRGSAGGVVGLPGPRRSHGARPHRASRRTSPLPSLAASRPRGRV